MSIITFNELVQAQQLVDSVLGTNQVQRPVEVTLKRQWFSGDMQREIKALLSSVSAHLDQPAVDGVSLFWLHVYDIARLLEDNGTLYSAAHRDFFFKPKKIATALVDMGHAWVNWQMVEEAQKLKKAS